MKASIRQIVINRQRLVAEADAQRGRVAADAEALGQSLRIADAAVRSYRRLKSHPLLVTAGLAAVAVFGPRRLLRLTYRAGLLLPALLRVARALRTPR